MMDNNMTKMVDYFRPPDNYFWRWAEGGQVIEWQDGETICYRGELLSILKQLSKDGLPSLGAVLLMISACKKQAALQGLPMDILHLLDYQEKNSDELYGMKDRMEIAIRFLQRIASLPLELRTGNSRTWLLCLVFEKVGKRKITNEEAGQVIDIFNSGRLDRDIFRAALPAEEINEASTIRDGISRVQNAFDHDITLLLLALKAFPTTQKLERAVRSGLQELPNG